MAQFTYKHFLSGLSLLMLFILLGTVMAQGTQPCGTDSGEGCAPQRARVDLYTPTFSNPTAITNPLFPASLVTKTLLLGHVDGQPLHVEYTLLSSPRMIDWNGQQIATVEVQYVAHIGGYIAEVALDWYAQDDSGAVWYFGEDLYNYEEGIIVGLSEQFDRQSAADD